MNEYIIEECKRFAKIVHAGIGRFDNLSELKERFEKEMLPYKNPTSKNFFLHTLTSEIDNLFLSHFNSCKKEMCPQNKTYKNIQFLILEEKGEMKLSSFLINNPEYDRILDSYNNKIDTTSSFLD